MTRDAEFWLRRQGLPYFVTPRGRGALLVARTGPFFVLALAVDAARWLLRGVDITVDDSAAAVAGLVALVGATALVLVATPLTVLALTPGAICRHPRRMTLFGLGMLAGYVVVDPWLRAPAGQSSGVVGAGASGSNAAGWSVTDWSAAWGIGGWAESLMVALLALALTWAGVGAFASWSARIAGRQLRALREMSGKVLPLLMLVVGLALVAPGLWQVTAALTPARLVAVIVLFGALGQWFIAPVIRSEALAIHEQNDEGRTAAALSRAERGNLTVVLVLAQGFQVALFSALVAVILIVFGELALTPAVIAAWSGGRTSPVELFGLQLPLDTALVKTAVFLSCFASLNFVVNIRSNAAYKSAFYDPLFDDARVALDVRVSYRRAGPSTRFDP